LQGIEPDESVLRGEALAESEDRVRSFPAGALPTQPAARFAALFAARRRWAAADILPYLQGVQASADEDDMCGLIAFQSV